MQFARRINRLSASPIRETLRVLDKPGMISFAGGLPAEDSFPAMSLERVPRSSLQYGASEGDKDLRERIAEHLQTLGLDTGPEQVFILSGSQQGIDLTAKLLVEEGTPVAVEAPTYLAALQVFQLFGAEFIQYSAGELPTLPLESRPPRLLYVNPTFQNPTGYCYDAAERMQLAKLCERYETVLFEDDPYRDLVYDTCERQPIVSKLRHGEWIYQSSFSKTFAPGLRLGYLACSESLAKYFSRLKQATDLHTNRLSQHIVREQFFGTDNPRRLERLRNLYRDKRDTFDHYLHQHLDGLASWEKPKGGLFFWLRLKSENAIDTRVLLTETLKKNVAFMPGEPFFPVPPSAANQLRLNFSLATEQQVDQGLAMLRECLETHLGQRSHFYSTAGAEVTMLKQN